MTAFCTADTVTVTKSVHRQMNTCHISQKRHTHTREKVKTTPTLLWLVISIKANTVRGVNWSLIIISSLLCNGVSFMFTGVCCSSLLSVPFVFLFIVSTVIEATKSLYSSTENSYLHHQCLCKKSFEPSQLHDEVCFLLPERCLKS